MNHGLEARVAEQVEEVGRVGRLKRFRAPQPAEIIVSQGDEKISNGGGYARGGWRERGRDLGFGAGIAQEHATLGQISFSERFGYTAIGTVCNVATCLCAKAKDGQILLIQRVNVV